jgi:hypothetical protein
LTTLLQLSVVRRKNNGAVILIKDSRGHIVGDPVMVLQNVTDKQIEEAQERFDSWRGLVERWARKDELEEHIANLQTLRDTHSRIKTVRKIGLEEKDGV